MSLLEAKNIHKVYNGAKSSLEVLKGVDLRIEEGAFVSIVGPSGAGKSTLLHILGGLDEPTQGQVILKGENIYDLGDQELSRARNKKIGFVFQFYHLLSEFTVLENVVMPGLIGGSRAQTLSPGLRESALGLLEEAGLKERSGHFPSELSGGEKQRAAIVRGLINKPSLLFCDEPTGNLDSKAGEGIMSLIRKINREDKMTVVLVTHNEILAKSADRVYHLTDGVLAG